MGVREGERKRKRKRSEQKQQTEVSTESTKNYKTSSLIAAEKDD